MKCSCGCLGFWKFWSLAERVARNMLDLSLAMMLALAMDILAMVITYLDAH